MTRTGVSYFTTNIFLHGPSTGLMSYTVTESLSHHCSDTIFPRVVFGLWTHVGEEVV